MSFFPPLCLLSLAAVSLTLRSTGRCAIKPRSVRLPVKVPAFVRVLPGALFLPVFAYLIPEMIISYADAASLMLGNLARRGEMSHHRVGVALPVGMRGQKDQWAAQPKNAA